MLVKSRSGKTDEIYGGQRKKILKIRRGNMEWKAILKGAEEFTLHSLTK